ncbi:phosphoinositide 3-kinase regulatory subunit 5-like isoform X2 [Myxocyprinus asiaticus]|uniref:phosphoinositide 3-kinase regulatory subunit 5-like isoform X2 n=1 Tax=Myxocyprinus asiaticus TaxID=70543 RepID=UPI00222141B3|nr:phosphoinositide 3-kinase regulatory subunit 5-like isoform X2 [Myxocyprinus asiaticus]
MDEADDRGVVCKLQELDSGVFYSAVIRVQGEEQWRENASLRSTSANNEVPRCIVKMQYTSCTEDRIQHALERCLDGLRPSESLTQSWNTGWCLNRWSLEELVKRDPENFLILLQQILRKAREVQEECHYELVAPLALMFESTLLQVPCCPSDGEILMEACEVFHGFLAWPEPYCSVSRNLLSTLHQELRAPGISYHRLMREEQGLATTSLRSKIITVLLMNPAEVPAEFLSVAEQLSGAEVSQRESSITLIKHSYQSVFGTKYSLQTISNALQCFSDDELAQILSSLSDLLESAAMMTDITKAREHVVGGLEALREKLDIPASGGKMSDGALQMLSIQAAKCYTFHWDKDNFDVLNDLLDTESEFTFSQTSESMGEEDDDNVDVEDDEDEDLDEMERFVSNGCVDFRASTFSTVSSLSTASKDSMFSTLSVASSECSPLSMLSFSSQASGTDSDFCEDAEEDSVSTASVSKAKTSARLSQRLSRLFKPRSSNSLCRAKSLGSPEAKELVVAVRSKRSNSLPQQVRLRSSELGFLTGPLSQLHYVCYRRRPILSSDDEEGTVGATLVRVVVFGADHVAGRVARAYSNLRKRERDCPHLTKAFRMRFFFMPVRRDAAPVNSSLRNSGSTLQLSNLSVNGIEDSTNDIANLLGMLDPWYERNTLSLLELPVNVVCQQTSKIESDLCEGTGEERLPIFADLVLYYCRHAACSALIQLYQAELTLAGGERRTEVFVHSLELGHTAGTRAIKAMGAASKRFGIDGDREAVPLSLEIIYNRVNISGRSQKTRAEKSCTSINLLKACRNPEELDSKMECLHLTMTEVLKRQNSKSKKGYNQHLTTTRVKVDKVQVCGTDKTTFAVCLDQDEKKIIQSVTRCEVSVCYKPDGSADWARGRVFSSHIQPLHPTFCSLLCLPVATFSGPQP